jgi:hypothetical protein
MSIYVCVCVCVKYLDLFCHVLAAVCVDGGLLCRSQEVLWHAIVVVFFLGYIQWETQIYKSSNFYFIFSLLMNTNLQNYFSSEFNLVFLASFFQLKNMLGYMCFDVHGSKIVCRVRTLNGAVLGMRALCKAGVKSIGPRFLQQPCSRSLPNINNQ